MRNKHSMEVANLSIENAIKILNEQADDLLKFVELKMQKYENVKFQEEFPKYEKPQSYNDNEQILGYSKGFLITYLIEFYLLKNSPSELVSYLKVYRIPYAKKYEKELKDIYNKL